MSVSAMMAVVRFFDGVPVKEFREFWASLTTAEKQDFGAQAAEALDLELKAA